MNQYDAWEMVCPGCQNACRLTVHGGKTLETLQRVQGAKCGAGFAHVRRYLAKLDIRNGNGRNLTKGEE